MSEYTAKDYKKGQPRWVSRVWRTISFLAFLHKAMAGLSAAL